MFSPTPYYMGRASSVCLQTSPLSQRHWLCSRIKLVTSGSQEVKLLSAYKYQLTSQDSRANQVLCSGS